MRKIKKENEFYFDGTYASLNRLYQYTHTRPWNEMKLGRCIIYTLKNLSMY